MIDKIYYLYIIYILLFLSSKLKERKDCQHQGRLNPDIFLFNLFEI